MTIAHAYECRRLSQDERLERTITSVVSNLQTWWSQPKTSCQLNVTAYGLPVASLVWLTPGAATEVTFVTPLFFPYKKPDDLCSRQFCGVTPDFFFAKTFFAHGFIAFYCFHSGVTPLEGVTPHLFYLSDLVSPLFFVNLPTIFLLRVSPPWRVSPGAVRPAPIVTPLWAASKCTCSRRAAVPTNTVRTHIYPLPTTTQATAFPARNSYIT